ncbi:unnamed protein product [Rangifer tarandus platyrhynchus]|uniref:Uncharacterized protein n=2 Tax=Rangifer tarandus platyrhynchus TaxID=3082113 RepID=A0ABN8XXD7_RANTA|nr:unnamed protein product [Rangifer tarandus platyrhynchus]CAI9692558.1 unnamed protein product [Rangifer tarandus platyrhynchus]
MRGHCRRMRSLTDSGEAAAPWPRGTPPAGNAQTSQGVGPEWVEGTRLGHEDSSRPRPWELSARGCADVGAVQEEGLVWRSWVEVSGGQWAGCREGPAHPRPQTVPETCRSLTGLSIDPAAPARDKPEATASRLPPQGPHASAGPRPPPRPPRPPGSEGRGKHMAAAVPRLGPHCRSM